MLKGIPSVVSPELLKTLSEMGHGDMLVIGDAFYPAASTARSSKLIRADGVRATDLIDAILQLIPLDTYVDHPVMIMDKMERDRETVPTPIWDEYINLVVKHDPRGKNAVGFIDRFEFYEQAKNAFAVLATGEEAAYGCVIIRKGVK